MAWTPRTTAPTNGTQPYDWNSGTIYECTWYAYWRVQEGGGYTPPCWYDGSGSTGYGTYTNAKYWLDHYRSPWQVKDTTYTPVPGDIIVFTGTYGHVVVVESVNSNGTYVITDYNLIAGTHLFGRKTNYTYPNRIQGANISTGNCIGCLHYPSSGPTPPPPTPTTTPEIRISPTYYSSTMASGVNYLDFRYTITISGIPDGYSVSGGNSYPGLSRVQNTGWTYTDYTVSGVTYRYAVKTQTLRYEREGTGSYTTTKYMYYNLTFPNGSISSTTPMYITVQASEEEPDLIALAERILRRKRKSFTLYNR